jgi:ribosomal protein S18 acetylase RimI-like enzyme
VENEVRAAVSSDASAIAAVHVASWQAAYRGIVPDSYLDALEPGVSEAQWSANFADNEASLFVASAQGSVIGFCSSVASRDDDLGPEVGEITAIYVAPEYWRSGAGRALLDVVLPDLSRRGFSAVSLWVFEENLRACQFYEALGFAHDGKQAASLGALEIPAVRYMRKLPFDAVPPPDAVLE